MSHSPLFKLGDRVIVKNNVPEAQKKHVGKTGYVRFAHDPNCSERPVRVGSHRHPAAPDTMDAIMGANQIFEFDASCLENDVLYNQQELARKQLLRLGDRVTVRNVDGMLNNQPDIHGIVGTITHIPDDIDQSQCSILVVGEEQPKWLFATFRLFATFLHKE